MTETYTIYLILFYTNQSTGVKVGALGNVYLSAGYYVYVGSARRAIGARLKRHRRIVKTKRWHLDYVRPALKWRGSIKCVTHDGECALADQVRHQLNGVTVKKRLGSSDCKCETHFLKLTGQLIPERLKYFADAWNRGEFTKS
ncbi:GIY-YIG nuclease family protein [Salisediminibacterium beveridgei]|uniref:GIY-YIG nuclease family protein n=1 Tax=Salisediminibacterium beveridgei TaxID=632773 RepID=UPI0008481FF2|nr:GIY-YIG nuclease family protein [Salisediminibacterium beveridgei]